MHVSTLRWSKFVTVSFEPSQSTLNCQIQQYFEITHRILAYLYFERQEDKKVSSISK